MFPIDSNSNRCFQSTCFHRFDGHDPRLESAKLINWVIKIPFRLNEILSYELFNAISIKASIQTCQIRKVIEQWLKRDCNIQHFYPLPERNPSKNNSWKIFNAQKVLPRNLRADQEEVKMSIRWSKYPKNRSLNRIVQKRRNC